MIIDTGGTHKRSGEMSSTVRIVVTMEPPEQLENGMAAQKIWPSL